ncbi:MAG: chromate transporter [Lentisphaeria bacterium]
METPELAKISKGRRTILLFWCYFKIASVVLGGGYAIVAAVQDEFCRKRKWISEDDILDMLTTIQTVPGLIASNSAIYMGWKINGFVGAVAALSGTILPPITIVICIAAGVTQIQEVLESPMMRGAFRGILSCVTGLILVTAIKAREKTIKDAFDLLVATGCFIGVAICKWNPIWLILVAIVLGVIKVCFFSRIGSKPQ